MKILIVSFFDDNFGDNLIRISFESILKVVLKNLKVDNYEINKMHLKSIDHELVCSSDVIFFAGGGLFGLSYLNFFDYLNEITELADEHNIPVIFSSMGINNMSATKETEQLLVNVLKRKCIKAVSVRENLKLFKKYAGKNSHLMIEEACDPAVWSKYIYKNVKFNNTKHKKPIVGINVVRGGLFKANGKDWDAKEEMTYLNDLKELLDKENMDYLFYTNGSFLDNTTLRQFVKEYDIPKEKVVFPHSTREFIEALSKCEVISAIRMHSAIVSYAYEIPSICLVWNDKIPFFYGNIGYPKRAIPIEKWNSNYVFEQIKILQKDKKYHHSKKYLMTVYKYLHKTISQLFGYDEEIYSFDRVAKEIEKVGVDVTSEDLIDYRMKCEKSEKKYAACLEKNEKLKKELKEAKKKLDYINNKFVVRVYHKTKRVFKRKKN